MYSPSHMFLIIYLSIIIDKFNCNIQRYSQRYVVCIREIANYCMGMLLETIKNAKNLMILQFRFFIFLKCYILTEMISPSTKVRKYSMNIISLCMLLRKPMLIQFLLNTYCAHQNQNKILNIRNSLRSSKEKPQALAVWVYYFVAFQFW